jgi:hypothetical protein
MTIIIIITTIIIQTGVEELTQYPTLCPVQHFSSSAVQHFISSAAQQSSSPSS